MNAGYLEHNVLGNHAAYGHDFTSALSQICYWLTIGDLVLNAILAKVVLNDGDALA